MTENLNPGIAQSADQQDRPVLVHDAAGKAYFVMTDQTFQKYVYDDSELTADEMLAAASSQVDAVLNASLGLP